LELVKHVCQDYAFHGPKEGQAIGKKYNNYQGAEFGIAAAELISPGQKKKLQKKARRENQGTSEQHQKAVSLCREFHCHRKKLLIREATCKINPVSQKSQKFELVFRVILQAEDLSFFSKLAFR